MKKFKVMLTRDYIVEIKANNEDDAKECAEFFVSGGLDASTIIDQQKYNWYRRLERTLKPLLLLTILNFEPSF